MAFEIQSESRDGVNLFRLQGRLVIGEPVQTLRSALQESLDAGQTRAVLDMSAVEYIDSSALGCLVMLHTKFEKESGVLVLFGLRRRQIDLLVITKLVTIFRIEQSEPDAINACFPGREAKHFDILNFVESQQDGPGGEAQ